MQRINESPGAFGKQQRGVQGDPMQMGAATPMTEQQPSAGGGGVGPGMQQAIAGSNPFSPVGSFNQRKQNAGKLYGPGGPGMEMNFGGGPGQGALSPSPRNGGGFSAPAGGFGGQGGGPGAGPGFDTPRPMMPPPGVHGFGPPQSGMEGGPGGGGGFHPALQQLFSNPQFMQMLQQYMQQQGGAGPRQPQNGPGNVFGGPGQGGGPFR